MNEQDLPIKHLLNNLDGVYMFIGTSWNITYVNPLSKNILGVSDESLIGADLRVALPDVISVFYKTLSKTLLKRQSSISSAYYAPTNITVELKVEPAEDGILAIFNDISAKHHDDKTIRDSNIRYKAFLEALSDALITINDKGLITFFNANAEKMFGYLEREIIGQNISILLPESDRKEHEDYTLYSDLHEARIINKDRELIAVRKDNSVFPIELHVSPMNIEGHWGYMGIIRDITERKSAEDKILEEKHKAEKASQIKSEFIDNMSHELRTPLNHILGFAQLLNMDSSLGDITREQVSEIYKAGQDLNILVDNVLDFSRINNDVKLYKDNVVLKELLTTSIEELSQFASEKDITITVEAKCHKYFLQSDPLKTKDVILNLLSNAIKYNKENGSVTIDCNTCDKDYLKIIITDTGQGIHESMVEVLFDPFNRLGQEGKAIRGVGLGLSISKKYTEAMGGEIGVNSVVGEGSQFWIKLPMLEQSSN